MKLGIVDLDTSHPENWIPIERDLGHEVVGVWDGGSVHPHGYAEKFAVAHKIPKVFSTLEEMVPAVDGAIIHGCDWDTHVAKARPFVAAGKAVLLDKPLAGKPRDLTEIRDWLLRGARITGGSSLRFCRETRNWLARPIAQRGMPHTVICGCGVDDFNYGIHAYAMLSGIMGPGIARVRHLGKNVQRRIEVQWADGRCGLLIVGRQEGWTPFHATILTEKGVTQFQPDVQTLYRGLLEVALPFLSGETQVPPVAAAALAEPELAALAALKSWSESDRTVALTELSPADPGYAGAAFAAEYRRNKYYSDSG